MPTLQKPKNHPQLHKKRPSRCIPQLDFWDLYKETFIQLCEVIIAKEGKFSYSITQKPEDAWGKKQVVIEERVDTVVVTVSHKDYVAITIIHTYESPSLKREIPRVLYTAMEKTSLFIGFSFRIHRPA